jgi:hypothetical protein
MSGLALTETLTGTLRLARDPGRERSIALAYRVHTGPLRTFLRRPLLAIEGAIDAQGFAEHRLLRGAITLVSQPERALEQAFSFTADDGLRYRFHGLRALRPGALTLLAGTITDARGALTARALLRLDLRTELGRLLASLRLHRP